MNDIHELSLSQCEALLRAGVAGRVALSTPTGPQIVPINYSVVDGAVVIRTSPYGVLGTYGREGVIAFEIDGVDHERQRGWSVVARGRVEAIHDPDEVERVKRVWEPRPWAGGQRALFLRLHPTEITGRQIGQGWDPMSTVPVRRVV